MIESIGGVAKEEYVKTVDHYILPNSFVLENLEPFPGYHGNLPTDQGPDTFFLITTEKYSAEKIFRIAHNVRHFTGYNFDASPARICVGTDSYEAIRIRDLKSYEPVAEIQQGFFDAGIKYQRKKKLEAVALIQLKKIFSLEEVNENILKDKFGSMHYIKINRQLTWGRFKKVTQWVKNNMKDNNFDAALAVIYGKDVYDLVRIYAETYMVEYLESIRKKYLDGIKRTD